MRKKLLRVFMISGPFINLIVWRALLQILHYSEASFFAWKGPARRLRRAISKPFEWYKTADEVHWSHGP